MSTTSGDPSWRAGDRRPAGSAGCLLRRCRVVAASIGGAPPSTKPIEVVMVESEDCHFCHGAREVLADLGGRYPLDIRYVDLSSAEGAELIRRTRAPFPPVLMVGGAFFGYGRISARKLDRHLQDLVAVV